MKVGLRLGYWRASPDPDDLAKVQLAERLGFDSVWTAEAYGSDCFTPLAWFGSRTERIRLGTAVAQIPARTPAATAMTAMTIDHLSAGRLLLGLGASGPQVAEGWHGQPFPRPLERTREYVDIVRSVVARAEPLVYDGRHYRLPLDGGTGLGKPLRSMVHPLREQIPILLGAEGPANIALAAEIADGWLPVFFAPSHDAWYREQLARGTARRAAGPYDGQFEIAGQAPVLIGDDIEECADRMRPALALYVAGMGAPSANYHFDSFARLGYEGDCDKIRRLWNEGRRADAAAAVPTSMIEHIAMIGPPAKISAELPRWTSSVLTSLLVAAPLADLPQIADLLS